MPIEFRHINKDNQLPGVRLESVAGRNPNLSPIDLKTLIIGERLIGNYQSEQFYTITSTDEAVRGFGQGSSLAEFARGFFLNNAYGTFDAIAYPLPDSTRTQLNRATINLTVGSTNQAGNLILKIDGIEVSVSIEANTTITAIRDAITSEILRNHTNLSMRLVSNFNGVQFDTTHRTAMNNRLHTVEIVSMPTGITAATTFYRLVTSGTPATNLEPDYTNIFNNEKLKEYDRIYLQFFGSVPAKQSFLNSFTYDDPTQVILCADTIQSDTQRDYRGSYSTLLQHYSGVDDRRLSIVSRSATNQNVHFFLGALAGRIKYEQEQNLPLPLQNVVLEGITVDTENFSQTERNQLLNENISTFRVDSGRFEIEKLVTFYKTNEKGVADSTWLEFVDVSIGIYIRKELAEFLNTKYQRYVIGQEGVSYSSTARVVTMQSIKDEISARLQRYIEEAILLESYNGVEVTIENNVVNFAVNLKLSNQLRIIRGQLQVRA